MKKFAAFIFAVFAFLAVVFGSYLPFTKARMFIAAIQTPFSSVEHFQNIYDQVFSFPSFVGGEEIVKFLANTVDSWVAANQDQADEAVLRSLAGYIEPKIDQSNVRHLLMIGNIYNNFWLKYKKPDDFAQAASHYRKINEIGPYLPHGLYSLLNLYIQAGMRSEARIVGEKILDIWPEDSNVQNLISSY